MHASSISHLTSHIHIHLHLHLHLPPHIQPGERREISDPSISSSCFVTIRRRLQPSAGSPRHGQATEALYIQTPPCRRVKPTRLLSRWSCSSLVVTPAELTCQWHCSDLAGCLREISQISWKLCPPTISVSWIVRVEDTRLRWSEQWRISLRTP